MLGRDRTKFGRNLQRRGSGGQRTFSGKRIFAERARNLRTDMAVPPPPPDFQVLREASESKMRRLGEIGRSLGEICRDEEVVTRELSRVGNMPNHTQLDRIEASINLLQASINDMGNGQDRIEASINDMRNRQLEESRVNDARDKNSIARMENRKVHSSDSRLEPMYSVDITTELARQRLNQVIPGFPRNGEELNMMDEEQCKSILLALAKDDPPPRMPASEMQTLVAERLCFQAFARWLGANRR